MPSNQFLKRSLQLSLPLHQASCMVQSGPAVRASQTCNLQPATMAAKEGASLLPTSSCSVKSVKAGEGRFPIKKRSLFWLCMTTFTFTFCWLSFLTCRSFQLEAAPVRTADTMHQLMASQEVRGSSCVSLLKIKLPGSWKKAAGKRRKDH